MSTKPRGTPSDPVTANEVVTPPATTVSGAEAAMIMSVIEGTPSTRRLRPGSCEAAVACAAFGLVL